MSKIRRVNVTINPDVLKKIDDYCSSNNITRSALITTACLQYVQAMSMIPQVQSQIDELKNKLNSLSLGTFNLDDISKV